MCVDFGLIMEVHHIILCIHSFSLSLFPPSLPPSQLTTGSIDAEQALRSTPPLRRRLRCFGPLLSPIFLQAFSLTFLAEWGDRSQITTIILGAREVGITVLVIVYFIFLRTKFDTLLHLLAASLKAILILLGVHNYIVQHFP